MILRSLTRYRDAGLLILRIGIGIMFLYHGAPKLIGGPEKWEKLLKSQPLPQFPVSVYDILNVFPVNLPGVIIL